MHNIFTFPNLFQQIFKIIWNLGIHVCTFVFMEEKEDKGVISVRPPEGSDIKERLDLLAKNTERSMNYHAVKAIEAYLDKNLPKVKKK